MKVKLIHKKDRKYTPPPKVGSELEGGSIFIREFYRTRKNGFTRDGIWVMKCKCGKEYKQVKYAILSGNGKTCGCHRASIGLYQSSKNKLLMTYKTHARNRKLKFGLTKDEFISFLTQDCFYCGKEPKNRSYGGNKDTIFYYNGIDRVDNKKGYIKKNCVPCCKNCNLAKKMLTQQEFFEMVKKIYEKHIQKK